MNAPLTIHDLERLIQDGVEESQQLEYKSVLAQNDSKEIGKDVSAMANASGGIIIYGIKEHSANRHLPESISPIDRSTFSKERLEQIINSNISPKVEGILIHPIQLESANQVAYVVEIPQSRTAHQNVKDYRYYKRYNFEVLAMQDYEIRDVMNREKHPKVQMHFELQIHTRVIKAAPNFALAGPSIKKSDTIVKTLTLKMRPFNVGSQYAKYVNYFVNLPLDIIESQEIPSLTELNGRIGQYYGENTYRDIVDFNHGIVGRPIPKYGPSRFDPILPGLKGRSNSIALNSDLLIGTQEISWQVHADNAPVSSGKIRLEEIKLTEKFD